MSSLLVKAVTFRSLVTLLVVAGVASCSSNSGFKSSKDSGPRGNVDVSHVEDAVPGTVKRTRAGNKNPYRVLGKTYHLLADSKGYNQTGQASWYGRKFHGRKTANGEVYDMYKMTAAHTRLPIPSYVRVTNVSNQRSVVVRVNDRGPFHGNRIIDLSYAAAKKLGFADQGVATVRVEDVTPEQAGVSAQPVQVQTVQSAQAIEPAQAVITPAPVEPVTVRSSQELNVDESTGVFVQVGAFREQSGALALVDKVKSLVVQPVATSFQDALYRVRVGPLSDSEVSAVEQQLNASGLDYRLVHR